MRRSMLLPKPQRWTRWWGWCGLLCLILLGLHCSQNPVNPEGGLVLCEQSSDCPEGYICQMNACLQRPGYYTGGSNTDAGLEVTPDTPPQDATPTEKPVGPEVVSELPVEKPPVEKPPVDEPACSQDSDCSTGEICNQGTCQAGCRQTQDCPSGQICLNLKCQVCQKDADCGTGQLCLNQACVKGDCRTTSDCLGGKLCKANQCVACTNDAECGSGNLCQNGACAPGACRQNSDCPNGLLCKQSKCEPCANDTDCGTGKLCINKVCVTGDCRFVSDCSAGKICKNNACSACTNNGECGSGKVCIAGACSSGNCVTSADCQNGQLCKSNNCAACANNAECGSGKVCDQGACKTGNCVTKADCTNNQVCKNNQCAACAADADCPSTAPSCIQGVCQIGLAFDAQNKAQRWADGTFAKDCGEYRFPPKGKAPATKDGVFWIKPDPTQPEFGVHCNMTYAGGGWTLVIKANGLSGVFKYDNAQWIYKTAFMPNDFAFDQKQAKLSSYHTVSVADVLIRMQEGTSGPLRSLIVRKQGKSLYDLIQPGTTVSFDVEAKKLSWKSLVGSPSLQSNCNKEGFNVKGDGSGRVKRVRIGIINNDQNSCKSTDSFVGIGSDVYSSGNYARSNGAGGNRDIRTFSYVYVRDLKSTVTPTLSNGALRYPDGTSAKNCQEYRLPPAASTKSDIYWIQPAGQSQPFKVFCLMLRQGGGWTLAMKADGRKTTFSYGASFWTTNTTHNPTSTAFDTNEAKYLSFSTVPFSEVKVLLYPFPITNSNFKYMILPKKSNSLLDLFKTSTYTPFDISYGVNAWREVISNGNIRTDCTREGFNSFSSSNACKNASANNKCARIRIGIIGDENNKCDSPDSRIGIGGDGTRCSQGSQSVGNTHQCSNFSSNRRDITSMGYVWVR